MKKVPRTAAASPPPETPVRPPVVISKTALGVALGVLLLLPIAGAFVPGPSAWGMNHLAHLPRALGLVWGLAALALALPATRRPLARAFDRAIPEFLFSPRGSVALVLAAAASFTLLREGSFFMGDGYLIGELVDRGVKFRAFDNLDYLIHHQVWKALGSGKVDSFALYRIGSILAGVLGVSLLLRWIPRLPWEPWRKVLVLGLVLFSGPVLLFHGYVESYSYLYVFLTLFLLTGLLALFGTTPLWVPATFYGLAMAFHLSAVFSAPALLYLGLRAPVRPFARRWLEVIAPPLLLFAISVGLHVLEGYNADWFRKEFIDSKNTKSMWIPWGTARGLSSLYHWKDLLNLALITAPVALSVVASVRGGFGFRDRGRGFLLIQILGVALCAVFIDRKLGGARDWDLFAAHSGGLLLLASLVFPAASSGKRGEASTLLPLALGAGLLCTAPWVLLEHSEDRSIARFVRVAEDFPDFARAYAYEEVGKYYRKGNDFERAEEMYERCIGAYPRNPRFRVLLGSVYFVRGKHDLAQAEYQSALELDPNHKMALEMMGKVLVQRAALLPSSREREPLYAQALEPFEKLTKVDPGNPAGWEGFGFTALRVERLEDALRAYRTALQINPAAKVWHELGTAYMGLGRYGEAVPAFRESIQRNEGEPRTRYGLAISALALLAQQREAEQRVDAGLLQEAEAQADFLLSKDPNSPQGLEIRRQVTSLRAALATLGGGQSP